MCNVHKSTNYLTKKTTTTNEANSATVTAATSAITAVVLNSSISKITTFFDQNNYTKNK